MYNGDLFHIPAFIRKQNFYRVLSLFKTAKCYGDNVNISPGC